MITQKVIELLNYRIEQEEYSSRLYEYISLCLDDKGYEYAPLLWKKYSEEELEHASWAKKYLLSFGIVPELRDIVKPYCDCSSLEYAIIETFKHEKLITEQCNELAKEALKLQDHNLYSLAIRYCKEQIEELNKAQTLVDKLETYGSDKLALVFLDKDLQNQL